MSIAKKDAEYKYNKYVQKCYDALTDSNDANNLNYLNQATKTLPSNDLEFYNRYVELKHLYEQIGGGKLDKEFETKFQRALEDDPVANYEELRNQIPNLIRDLTTNKGQRYGFAEKRYKWYSGYHSDWLYDRASYAYYARTKKHAKRVYKGLKNVFGGGISNAFRKVTRSSLSDAEKAKKVKKAIVEADQFLDFIVKYVMQNINNRLKIRDTVPRETIVEFQKEYAAFYVVVAQEMINFYESQGNPTGKYNLSGNQESGREEKDEEDDDREDDDGEYDDKDRQ